MAVDIKMLKISFVALHSVACIHWNFKYRIKRFKRLFQEIIQAFFSLIFSLIQGIQKRHLSIFNWKNIILIFIIFIISRGQLSSAETIMKITNNSSDLNFDLVPEKLFNNSIFKDFSKLKVLNHLSKDYIFVISKNSTILQLDVNSMKIEHFYDPSLCHPGRCQNNDIFINLMTSVIQSNQDNTFVYCFIKSIEVSSSQISQCFIGDTQNTHASTIQRKNSWNYRGFSSTRSSQNSLIEQTKQHIFLANYIGNLLSIQRISNDMLTPAYKWQDVLSSPPTRYYFEEETTLLTSFQTEYEVYFLVREDINRDSLSTGQCNRYVNNAHTISLTRLVRVCKMDPGTEGIEITDSNSKSLATLTKADIQCNSGEGFLMTRALWASWTGSRLYIGFANQKNNIPSNTVICEYNLETIESSFNGPVRDLWTDFSCLDNKLSKYNIPNMCRRLSQFSLSQAERILVSTISIMAPYKAQIIKSTKVPVLELNQAHQFHGLVTQELAPGSNTHLLIIFNSKRVMIYYHYSSFSVSPSSLNKRICLIGQYHSQSSSIQDVSLFYKHGQTDPILFVSESNHVSKINVNRCGQLKSFTACSKHADWMCIWSNRDQQCQFNYNSPERCPVSNRNWDLIEDECAIHQDQLELRCLCSIRHNNSIFNIHSCEGSVLNNSVPITNHLRDKCALNYVKQRTRSCSVGQSCPGSDTDIQLCLNNNLSTTSQSSWSKWREQPHWSKHIRRKYRGKCQIGKPSTNKIASVEINEQPCGNMCEDADSKQLNWSKWSNCVNVVMQYRLYDCPIKVNCPLSQIQVKQCHESSLRKSPLISNSTTVHSDRSFTLKHVILTVTLVSGFWLLVIICVIAIRLVVLRYNPDSSLFSTSGSSASYRLHRLTSEQINTVPPVPPHAPPNLRSPISITTDFDLTSPPIIYPENYFISSNPSSPSFNPPTPPPHLPHR